jgi:hypothetical protein
MRQCRVVYVCFEVSHSIEIVLRLTNAFACSLERAVGWKFDKIPFPNFILNMKEDIS